MKGLITLTSTSRLKLMLFVSEISVFRPYASGSAVYFGSDPDPVYVKETPEEIAALISAAS